jgi:phytoene dehydrogenase-like protein
MHICPNIEYVERAWDDAKYGRPSERPLLELTVPTMYDPSLAPPGKHIMGIFLQYAPYTLREGTWDELREPFGDRVIALIDEYAPGFSSKIEHRQVLSPLDLERRFGITGGNIFHGEMSLDQMFVMRPVAGWARYRTPVKGLFLCGSGAHPGGGVMGAPGYNCAREMLPIPVLARRSTVEPDPPTRHAPPHTRRSPCVNARQPRSSVRALPPGCREHSPDRAPPSPPRNYPPHESVRQA